MTPRLRFKALLNDWEIMSWYQRFEGLVALVLTLVIGLIVLVALYRLTVSVVGGLMLGILDPLQPSDFQLVFGEIMTVLIALEFNHTLRYVVSRQQSVIHIKIVLLIALLAVARKFIVLELGEVSAEHLMGLAAVTLVLGVVYWLMRERDDRLRQRADGVAHERLAPEE